MESIVFEVPDKSWYLGNPYVCDWAIYMFFIVNASQDAVFQAFFPASISQMFESAGMGADLYVQYISSFEMCTHL